MTTESVIIERAGSLKGNNVEGKPNPRCLGLFDVPEEVQEFILALLNVKDLIASGQVCRQWRIGVNKSRVWKKWCIFESYEPKLMDRCASLSSNPTFNGFGAEEETGLWKKTYEWHEKLGLNWKRKNIMSSHRLLEEDDDGKVVAFDTDGDFVALALDDAFVKIWSIKSAIPFLAGKLSAVLRGHPILSVRVNKDLVLVVQRKLLQVFHRRNGKYFLSDLKCFELGANNEDLLSAYEEQRFKFSRWYVECFRANGSSYASSWSTGPIIYQIHDETLFAAATNAHEVKCWTLPGSEASFCCSELPPVTQIISEVSGVYVTASNSEITCFLKFRPETQTFEELFTVPGLKKFLIGYDLIVAFPSPGDVALKRIRAFSHRDGKVLKRFRDITVLVDVVICRPSYVLYMGDWVIQVWDPIQDQIVGCFPTEYKLLHCRTAFSSFALVLSEMSLDVWDWRTGTKLYRLRKICDWKAENGYLIWSDSTRVIVCGENRQLEIISFI